MSKLYTIDEDTGDEIIDVDDMIGHYRVYKAMKFSLPTKRRCEANTQQEGCLDGHEIY